MKVKDLMNINPEAEIKVIFADGTPYEGKLDYGWSADDSDDNVDTKSIAKEVCIFLGDISENIGKA